MTELRRQTEVLRVLERYLVEVVEAHDLCPWARSARTRGNLAVDVVWGTPTPDVLAAAASVLLDRPDIQVAIVVAPELDVTPAALRALRDRVAAALPTAGVADFHPEAALDLATPARLVPFVRRSPDPMLQLVPLTVLDVVRAAPPAPPRATQAQILGGHAPAPRADAAARIAAANHATVTAHHTRLVATLADIAEDRRRSYAAVGISTSR